MRYEQGNAHELRRQFWKALADSPFVMLQLDASAESAAPMTAQLDEDADHAIWFFTSRDNHFAAGGAATATFAGKDHDVFARFAGTLLEETDPARRNRQWNRHVESWFAGGKTDPAVLMLRMDLGDAAIWAGDPGTLNTVKMALGMRADDGVKGEYTHTRL